MPEGYVFDTNVLIVANHRDTHANVQHQAICSERLLAATHEIVVVDANYHVFTEYERHCNANGSPGVGDFFLRWLASHIGTPDVQSVHIGRTRDEITMSLPVQLRKFDPSDHKWLALHLAGDAVAIVNAADSDYSEKEDALLEVGINVEELCPDLLHRHDPS